MDDQDLPAVDAYEQVLALTRDAFDLVPLEVGDEVLLGPVPPDGTQAGHLDRLDALADDLLLEVPADRLHLGQLRHRRPVSRRPSLRRRSGRWPARGGPPRRPAPRPARPASWSGPRPSRAPFRRGSPGRRTAWRGRDLRPRRN